MRLLAGILVVAAAAAVYVFATAEPSAAPGPDAVPDTVAFDVHTSAFVLDPEVQRYVWDIEGYAHILQMEFAPRFCAALKEGRADDWLAYLAPGFTAEVPAGEPEVVRHGPVEVRTWPAAGEAIDGPALFRRLAAFTQAGLVDVGLHVDDLSPRVRGDFEGAWTGTWSLDFRTPAPGSECAIVCEVEYARIGARPADEGGWIRGLKITAQQQRTAAAPLLEDVTGGSGILAEMLTDTWRRPGKTVFYGAYLFDYDRDDRLDLLVIDEPNTFVYRGLGRGRFQDVSADTGLLAPARGVFVSATIADLDNDGYEDVVFLVRDRIGQRPVVYRNRTDGTFRPVDARLPPVQEGNASVADYDGDGLVDLYFPNSGAPVPEREATARWIGDRTGPEGTLLRNRGGFVFEDVTAAAGAGGGNREILGSLWIDLEPDGDPDLVLVNHMGENALLENRGDGTFLEHPFARTFGGFSMGAAAGDLDEDGDPDLYVANMSSRAGHRVIMNLRPSDYPPGVHELMYGWIDGNEMMENTGDRSVQAGFRVVETHMSGWAYGPALVDLDGDGRLDVYCPAGYQSVDPRQPDG